MVIYGTIFYVVYIGFNHQEYVKLVNTCSRSLLVGHTMVFNGHWTTFFHIGINLQWMGIWLINDGWLMIRSIGLLLLPHRNLMVSKWSPHFPVPWGGESNWPTITNGQEWALKCFEHCSVVFDVLVRFLNGFFQHISRSRNHVIPFP